MRHRERVDATKSRNARTVDTDRLSGAVRRVGWTARRRRAVPRTRRKIPPAATYAIPPKGFLVVVSPATSRKRMERQHKPRRYRDPHRSLLSRSLIGLSQVEDKPSAHANQHLIQGEGRAAADERR